MLIPPSTYRAAGVARSLLLGVAVLCFADTAGAGDDTRANDLKAAYLFNFAKLVEWSPATPADTLTVCFVGASGVREAFVHAAGDKQVSGRHIVVKLIARLEPHAACDVLYMEAALANGTQRIEDYAPSALTVSDAPDFAAHGGMIELFSEGNRLRFNINLPSAQRAGLRISSSLLQLAARIERGASQ